MADPSATKAEVGSFSSVEQTQDGYRVEIAGKDNRRREGDHIFL